MIISISKAEIFAEVEKRSSLEGLVAPEQFDNAWANESRGELLDSYWIEGYTALIQLFKKYLSSDTITYTLSTFNSSETLTINAEMPSRYDSTLDGSISTDAKMLLACNILTGWMKVVMPEAAVKYEEEAKGYSEDLRVKLLYRKNPTDTLNAAKEDTEGISTEEVALSAAKEDTEPLGYGRDYIQKAKKDDIILNQGWDGCPYCEGEHENKVFFS